MYMLTIGYVSVVVEDLETAAVVMNAFDTNQYELKFGGKYKKRDTQQEVSLRLIPLDHIE